MILKAIIKTKKGKSFSRKLRINNQFPGVVYGLNKNPISIILEHDSVFNLQKKVDFFNTVIILSINEKKYNVKVQAIQRHPFKLKLMHIDFIHVKM